MTDFIKKGIFSQPSTGGSGTGTGSTTDEFLAVIGDQQLSDDIAAGVELESIYLIEGAGNAVTVDLGTSAGGNQIQGAVLVPANGEFNVQVRDVYDWSSVYDVYISSGAWGGASLTVYVTYKAIA